MKNKKEISAYQKVYYLKNKDKKLQYQKEYRFKNIKKINKYIKENKEQILNRQRIYYPNYVKKNKNKLQQYHEAYYLKNKEKTIANKKKYYSDNKEIIDKKHKMYYFQNKERINQIKRKYYQKNKDYFIKLGYIRKKEKLKMDPYFKLTEQLRNRVRMAFHHYSKTGKILTAREYGIDYGAIIKYLEKSKPDDYTSKKYHIDHIKPLCSFGLNDLEEVKKAFAPKNHQWLTAEANLKKGNRVI